MDKLPEESASEQIVPHGLCEVNLRDERIADLAGKGLKVAHGVAVGGDGLEGNPLENPARSKVEFSC